MPLTFSPPVNFRPADPAREAPGRGPSPRGQLSSRPGVGGGPGGQLHHSHGVPRAGIRYSGASRGGAGSGNLSSREEHRQRLSAFIMLSLGKIDLPVLLEPQLELAVAPSYTRKRSCSHPAAMQACAHGEIRGTLATLAA